MKLGFMLCVTIETFAMCYNRSVEPLRSPKLLANC